MSLFKPSVYFKRKANLRDDARKCTIACSILVLTQSETRKVNYGYRLFCYLQFPLQKSTYDT